MRNFVICQLCHQMVFGPSVAIIGQDPNSQLSEEQRTKLAEMQKFDLLAGAMFKHILESHQRPHAMEMNAVGFIAAKVYAMCFAESKFIDNFNAIRTLWRRTFIDELAKRGQAADCETGPNGSAEADPSGSNEKKSERKVST